MRLRSYTPEGAPIWLDQGPSTPLAPRQIHGSLVVGEHGQVEKQRKHKARNQNQRRALEKAA